MNRRIVITGCGTINPIGNNKEETLRSLLIGKSGITIDNTFENLSFSYFARLKEYDASKYFNSRDIIFFDKASQLSLIAVKEALMDSAVDLNELPKKKCGVFFGACNGGEETREKANYDIVLKNKKCSPLTLLKVMQNAITGNICTRYKLCDQSAIFSNACSSFNSALIYAYNMIKFGELECALVGATEASLVFGELKSWEQLGVISKTGCFPFSKKRDGTILGEGSAVFFIETLESALKRNARIYVEITGYGSTTESVDFTKPSEKGIIKAYEQLLEKINPADIDYINAHGTGTITNDSIEIGSLRKVFQTRIKDIYITSTKSFHGHLLGAAGAMELLCSILSVNSGIIFPNLNCSEIDEAFSDLKIPVKKIKKRIKTVVSNSFAFGGANTIIAIQKYS